MTNVVMCEGKKVDLDKVEEPQEELSQVLKTLTREEEQQLYLFLACNQYDPVKSFKNISATVH